MKRHNKAGMANALALISALIFCCYVYSTSIEEDAIKKGIEYIRQDDSDNAIAEFSKVIAINPDSADAYYNRASVYYKKGKLAESVSDFNKVLALNPSSADAYYDRGLVFYKMGLFNEAIADYDKVLKISPQSTDALYGRGLAHFKKNNIKQAISDYNKAIEIRPELPLAYSARAIAYFSRKDYSRTLADVNKAVALGFRLRPLKETATESFAAPATEKIETSKIAEKPSDRSQAWKAKRRAAIIKIYALTVLFIICLAIILMLLIKIKNKGRF